jgi:hypothetical protein
VDKRIEAFLKGDLVTWASADPSDEDVSKSSSRGPFMVTLASGSPFANASAAKAVSPASSVGTMAEALLATTDIITTRNARGNRMSGKQYRFCFAPKRLSMCSYLSRMRAITCVTLALPGP